MLEKYADLPPEQEAIVASVIGCAITVHKALGPGFKETIYHTAFKLELDSNGFAYESEKPIQVKHKPPLESSWLVFASRTSLPTPASGRRPSGSRWSV